MKTNRYYLYCIILLLLACSSKAVEPFPFASEGWDTSQIKIIEDDYLLFLDVTIGTTKLIDVQNYFGSSLTFKLGTENYSPNLLCYVSNDTNDNTVVVFQSGPLGGWDIVTAMFVGSTIFIDKANCSKSELITRESVNINHISLGQNVENLMGILGEPTFTKNKLIVFRYQKEIVLGKNKKFDVSSGIETQINDKDEVVWFRVYKQLSN